MGLREAWTPINQGSDESFLSNWEDSKETEEEKEERTREEKNKITD